MDSTETATLELDAARIPIEALSDLVGIERLWILAYLDRGGSFGATVIPPRGPRVRRGLFSTRSPDRPNPIGLSAVALERVEGHVLHLRGVDLLDGTPVLDIKPYLPYADAFPEARAGWIDTIPREALQRSRREGDETDER